MKKKHLLLIGGAAILFLLLRPPKARAGTRPGSGGEADGGGGDGDGGGISDGGTGGGDSDIKKTAPVNPGGDLVGPDGTPDEVDKYIRTILDFIPIYNPDNPDDRKPGSTPDNPIEYPNKPEQGMYYHVHKGDIPIRVCQWAGLPGSYWVKMKDHIANAWMKPDIKNSAGIPYPAAFFPRFIEPYYGEGTRQRQSSHGYGIIYVPRLEEFA